MRICSKIPIEIPDSGRLEKVPVSLSNRCYSKIVSMDPRRLGSWSEIDLPNIEIDLRQRGESWWSGSFRQGINDSVYLVWISSRGEWICVHQEIEYGHDFSWRSLDGITPDGPFRQSELEASFHDGSWSSDKFHGPYAIDEQCEDIVLRFYGRKREDISGPVYKANPDVLSM